MERITADALKMPVSTAKTIRKLTAPPVMAILLSTALYIALGNRAFANPLHYFTALFTLGFLPLLAYPLCAFVPEFKKGGRRLERNIAIAFSVAGYVLGVASALVMQGTRITLIIFFTYLISGLITALLSFAFKFKASGHTCGVSGPTAMFVYTFGPAYLPLFLLLIPVFVSSLKLKRHTVWQLIAGCFVPIAAMIISIFIASAIR